MVAPGRWDDEGPRPAVTFHHVYATRPVLAIGAMLPVQGGVTLASDADVARAARRTAAARAARKVKP